MGSAGLLAEVGGREVSAVENVNFMDGPIDPSKPADLLDDTKSRQMGVVPIEEPEIKNPDEEANIDGGTKLLKLWIPGLKVLMLKISKAEWWFIRVNYRRWYN